MTSSDEQPSAKENDTGSHERNWKFWTWKYWRLPIKRRSTTSPPIGEDDREDYPELGQRLQGLEATLIPKFREHDQEALKAQAAYRRYRLLVIIGAGVTTVFGAVQASGGNPEVAGAVIAGAGALTAMFSNLQRQSRPLARYINERAKAEGLRSLYFRYLSGQETLEHPRPLERQVADIRFSDPGKGQP